MSKKIIYFVRHGETVLNAEGVRQGAKGPLSERGRAQALATAFRFPTHKGKPEVIIASPFERTKETAEIIAHELKMSVEYNELLVERRNPSEVIGHWSHELEVKDIMDKIERSDHPDDFRFSDEENFLDLKERAKKLLAYIKTRPEKRIIMVTHSIFLKMVVAYILHGEKLTAPMYNNLSLYNPIDNASMAICEYKNHLLWDRWKLLVWNDLA